MVHHPSANRCPFCGAEIRRSVWDMCVIPAYGTMEDANLDMIREYTGYPGTSLFQIEYQANRQKIHIRKDNDEDEQI